MEAGQRVGSLTNLSLQMAEGRLFCLYGLTGHMLSGKPQHSTLKQSRW